MRKYHFITGLPRSGSTLLSAILKQNPRFTANISDPLHEYVKSINRVTNTAAGMDAVVDIDKRRELMRALFDTFYSSATEVCFNTNRGWSSDTPILKDLYPDFRMIVCIRDVPWILDSFEVLNTKNPHTIKPLYHHQELGNVYDRTHMLMGGIPNFAGYVGAPLANTSHAAYCSERDHLMFVEYEHLVKQPATVIRQIYEFLGEPLFQHDYSNVEDSYDEFDVAARIDGLHTVRKEVRWIERRSVLPNDLWNQYSSNTFWKQPGFEIVKSSLNWSMSVRSQAVPRLNRQL